MLNARRSAVFFITGQESSLISTLSAVSRLISFLEGLLCQHAQAVHDTVNIFEFLSLLHSAGSLIALLPFLSSNVRRESLLQSLVPYSS